MCNKRIENGVPAFPQRTYAADASGSFCGFSDNPGMSLRVWLAAMASDEDVFNIVKIDLVEESNTPPTRQEARFIHADRMLKASQKPVNPG